MRGQGVRQVQVVLGERVLHQVAVQVQNPDRPAGGPQQHAQDRRHRPVGDALRHLQLVVLVHRAVEDRLAPGEAPLGELLGEVEPAARLAVPDGRLAQPQLRLRPAPLGQHDRPALGVEHVDRVVEDGVEEMVLVVDVDEVVAGPDQSPELVAGPGQLLAVERDPPQPLLIARRGGGHAVLVRDRPLDDDGDLAELEDVAGPQRVLARPDPHPVDVRPVGALQVADEPPVVPEPDLGVAAADRAVVEDDLQRPEAAGAQDRGGLPHLSFDVAADAAESDCRPLPTHARLPAHGVGPNRVGAPIRQF